MSHESLYQCSQDGSLQHRVTAAGQKEVLANPQFGNTYYGGQLKQFPGHAITWFMWPISVDYEAQYASALAAGNPDPGGDPAVISDANISAAVQTHWPADPT